MGALTGATHSRNVPFSEAQTRRGQGARAGRPALPCVLDPRGPFRGAAGARRPAPRGRGSPSGRKQINAETLQIGGLPQLARRLECSAALTEESRRLLLPLALSLQERGLAPSPSPPPPARSPRVPGGWGSGAGRRTPSAPRRCAALRELSATTDL